MESGSEAVMRCPGVFHPGVVRAARTLFTPLDSYNLQSFQFIIAGDKMRRSRHNDCLTSGLENEPDSTCATTRACM